MATATHGATIYQNPPPPVKIITQTPVHKPKVTVMTTGESDLSSDRPMENSPLDIYLKAKGEK